MVSLLDSRILDPDPAGPKKFSSDPVCILGCGSKIFTITILTIAFSFSIIYLLYIFLIYILLFTIFGVLKFSLSIRLSMIIVLYVQAVLTQFIL